MIFKINTSFFLAFLKNLINIIAFLLIVIIFNLGQIFYFF